MDGKVIPYVAVSATQNVSDFNEDFAFADGSGNDEFSYARGRGRKLKKSGKSSRRGGGFFSKLADNQREKNRLKWAAKSKQADAQVVAAKNLGQDKQSDVEMAKALSKIGADAPEEKKGLSTGAKVGIALGVVAVLGIVGFVVYKKMNKGK